ncbi:hypothetical protein TWF696_000924 [Orbilia brochopaga]|uniref:Uncharacterized protein n=1 Tax=Orbilia brochopaga TaxID=3140254 RepID=A0AAV9VCT4_9PEZI
MSPQPAYGLGVRGIQSLICANPYPRKNSPQSQKKSKNGMPSPRSIVGLMRVHMRYHSKSAPICDGLHKEICYDVYAARCYQKRECDIGNFLDDVSVARPILGNVLNVYREAIPQASDSGVSKYHRRQPCWEEWVGELPESRDGTLEVLGYQPFLIVVCLAWGRPEVFRMCSPGEIRPFFEHPASMEDHSGRNEVPGGGRYRWFIVESYKLPSKQKVLGGDDGVSNSGHGVN